MNFEVCKSACQQLNSVLSQHNLFEEKDIQ